MSNPIYSRSTRLKVNKAYPFFVFNVLDFYHNMVYNKKGREDDTPLFKSPNVRVELLISSRLLIVLLY